MYAHVLIPLALLAAREIILMVAVLLVPVGLLVALWMLFTALRGPGGGRELEEEVRRLRERVAELEGRLEEEGA